MYKLSHPIWTLQNELRIAVGVTLTEVSSDFLESHTATSKGDQYEPKSYPSHVPGAFHAGL